MKHCETCCCDAQGIDPDEPGVVGRKHPKQSRQAAAVVRAGTQLAEILDYIVAEGEDGLNAAELVPLTNLTISVLGTRLGALRKRRLIMYKRVEGEVVLRQGSSPTTTSAVHVSTWAGRRLNRRLSSG